MPPNKNLDVQKEPDALPRKVSDVSNHSRHASGVKEQYQSPHTKKVDQLPAITFAKDRVNELNSNRSQQKSTSDTASRAEGGHNFDVLGNTTPQLPNLPVKPLVTSATYEAAKMPEHVTSSKQLPNELPKLYNPQPKVPKADSQGKPTLKPLELLASKASNESIYVLSSEVRRTKQLQKKLSSKDFNQLANKI